MSASRLNQQSIKHFFSQQAFVDQVSLLRQQTDNNGFDFFALPRVLIVDDETKGVPQTNSQRVGYSPKVFGQVSTEPPLQSLKQSNLSTQPKPDNFSTLLPLPKTVVASSRPASNRIIKSPPTNTFSSHSMARKISDKLN